MISIIVPYRDRPEHLEEFLKAMLANKQDKEVIIVEQEPGKPFNRGKLLNIGALHADGEYLIFHDVDMIPEFEKYPISKGVTQLAKSEIQKIGYLGGVTMFDKETFFKSLGYPNHFFHRAEDNYKAFRLIRLGFKIVNNFCKFNILNHERPKMEFDIDLWNKAKIESQSNENMIKNCLFDILQFDESGFIKKYLVSI